jgi:hypothetical protein
LEQQLIAKHGVKSPCAVGFRVFENPDVYESNDTWGRDFAFNYDELKPLLEDRTVKKIILERTNTEDQWLSVQRACWFHDMTDHHERDAHRDQQRMVSERAQNGVFCGGPKIANFTTYKQTKDRMYRRWHHYLDSDYQPYIAIKTEDLDKLKADPSELQQFLLPPPTCESCSNMSRTITEIKHMVDEHYPDMFKQHVQLRDTPDPREGMSDIHFALLPGYKVLGETSVNLSELPWVYQCGLESAVRTGSKVTFWYRGFPQGHVHDDITDGKLHLKHHAFQGGTQTGDWWHAHSRNETLTCPNSEVTVSDFIRQDILHRFGGIYMDLDLIILDDRLPHGPDGIPAQHVTNAWKDQTMVGNYLKYSPTTRFGKCMFEMWKLHWDAYVNHNAKCVGLCHESDGRDVDKQWGFMGPSLVTHAYLSCKDDNVSVYPPSAFGNDPHPCNLGLVHNDAVTLKGNAYALHTCHELATAVEDLGSNLKQNTTMANVMLDRCPKTNMRMRSRKAPRRTQVSQSLMAYFLRHP